MPHTTLTLLLIDGQTLFRSGLALILPGLQAETRVIEGATVVQACEQHVGVHVDLILAEFSDAHQAAPLDAECAMLKRHFPQAPIVLMAARAEPGRVREAIQRGAAGIVPKDSSVAVLLSALKLVLAGGIYLPPAMLAAAGHPGVAAGTADGSASSSPLSERQREVLMLAVTGRLNRQIAADLGISEGTVKQHLSAAYRALGVRNRTEAVLAASERRLWRSGELPTLEQARSSRPAGDLRDA